MNNTLALVLAAGEGTRMVSARPKVLHEVAGAPMVFHVLAATKASGIERVCVVAGPGAQGAPDPALAEALSRFDPKPAVYVQHERRGTAHAVLAAREAIAAGADKILILFGDTPLIAPSHLEALLGALDAPSTALAIMGFEAKNPHGYGRLLCDAGGNLTAIREEKDASAAERAISLCNGGLMALSGSHALPLLDAVLPNNAKGEYYLTDCVALAHHRGLYCRVVIGDAASLMGVNTRAELAAAEAAYQARARAHWLAQGVTMVAPDTVFFSHDTVLARDVVLEPHVFFGPRVGVGEGVAIRGFCHLEGVTIAPRCVIGPFARLRPGTALGEACHIGNFVELKAANIGAGAKINHLSYVGDAVVGAAANIGAGAITCNYDGQVKSVTRIGARAFIGSNSALVAPLTIGAGAYVGSGSVITQDVPADALALGRARQTVKDGWARARRGQKHKHENKPPEDTD